MNIRNFFLSCCVALVCFSHALVAMENRKSIDPKRKSVALEKLKRLSLALEQQKAPEKPQEHCALIEQIKQNQLKKNEIKAIIPEKESKIKSEFSAMLVQDDTTIEEICAVLCRKAVKDFAEQKNRLSVALTKAPNSAVQITTLKELYNLNTNFLEKIEKELALAKQIEQTTQKYQQLKDSVISVLSEDKRPAYQKVFQDEAALMSEVKKLLEEINFMNVQAVASAQITPRTQKDDSEGEEETIRTFDKTKINLDKKVEDATTLRHDSSKAFLALERDEFSPEIGIKELLNMEKNELMQIVHKKEYSKLFHDASPAIVMLLFARALHEENKGMALAFETLVALLEKQGHIDIDAAEKEVAKKSKVSRKEKKCMIM